MEKDLRQLIAEMDAIEQNTNEAWGREQAVAMDKAMELINSKFSVVLAKLDRIEKQLGTKPSTSTEPSGIGTNSTRG